MSNKIKQIEQFIHVWHWIRIKFRHHMNFSKVTEPDKTNLLRNQDKVTGSVTVEFLNYPDIEHDLELLQNHLSKST